VNDVDDAGGSAVTAVSMRGRALQPAPLAWLPWAALAVAVTLVVVMVVLSLVW
jgi:hypothetical protein